MTDKIMDETSTQVYKVEVNGSPSKMVVLSAKSNKLLAQMFKVSANYLAKD